MRRAAKIDINQPVIVKALRSAGAYVQPLHTVGKGCPDLLVGHRGKWTLLEIKANDKAKLTPDELNWHIESWGTCHAPLFIVTTAEQAVKTCCED